MSSVWNFCHWVADFPPRETSPGAKSEEKRMFSQVKQSWITYQFIVCFLPWSRKWKRRKGLRRFREKLLGAGHYLCRGGGGKKEGGVKAIPDGQEGGRLYLFIKMFRGVSSLIARYILKGVHWPRWVKQLNSRAHLQYLWNSNAKLYNFMLILLLFVNLKHHYFVQLSHLYLKEILFALWTSFLFQILANKESRP